MLDEDASIFDTKNEAQKNLSALEEESANLKIFNFNHSLPASLIDTANLSFMAERTANESCYYLTHKKSDRINKVNKCEEETLLILKCFYKLTLDHTKYFFVISHYLKIAKRSIVRKNVPNFFGAFLLYMLCCMFVWKKDGYYKGRSSKKVIIIRINISILYWVLQLICIRNSYPSNN